jgi:hypothetical protein
MPFNGDESVLFPLAEANDSHLEPNQVTGSVISLFKVVAVAEGEIALLKLFLFPHCFCAQVIPTGLSA